VPGATNAAWGGATFTVTIGDTDMSCHMRDLYIDRSKNRVWDPADAGLCRVSLNMRPGGVRVDAAQVGDPIKVNVAYGVATRDLFTGRVQFTEAQVDPQQGDVLVVHGVDEFEQLARANRRAATGDAAVGAGETVDHRIGRWLDVAGSTSPRAIGASEYTCPGVLIDGNCLRQLQAAAQADGGDLFIAGDGTVTFLPWAWQVTADTAVAVFSDRRLNEWVPYSKAHQFLNLDEVQNDVTGTRRAISDTDLPEPQTVLDTTSVTTYGSRGDSLDDLELSTDTEVANRISALVTVAGMPNARFDSVVVQPAFDPPRSWPRTIPVTFGSLIAVNRLWEVDAVDQALYGHVIGELWTVSGTDASVEFRVSGTGTWDALRPPRVPMAIEYCPDGTIRVPKGYPCDYTSTVVLERCDHTVIATYPPGSLCTPCTTPGGILPTADTCYVCYDDGTHELQCTALTPETTDAILWFDVLEPGPSLIERVDGDAIDTGAGFAGTRLGVVPGSRDAIDANATGGPITLTMGHQNSSHVAATNFDGGWRLAFWLNIPSSYPSGTDVLIINLESVEVHVVSTTLTGPNIDVGVTDAGGLLHRTGPIGLCPADTWHEWRVSWDPATNLLSILLDGVDP
jgi:hypothetical protein